jgi:hypothetical protein
MAASNRLVIETLLRWGGTCTGNFSIDSPEERELEIISSY